MRSLTRLPQLVSETPAGSRGPLGSPPRAGSSSGRSDSHTGGFVLSRARGQWGCRARPWPSRAATGNLPPSPPHPGITSMRVLPAWLYPGKLPTEICSWLTELLWAEAWPALENLLGPPCVGCSLPQGAPRWPGAEGSLQTSGFKALEAGGWLFWGHVPLCVRICETRGHL